MATNTPFHVRKLKVVIFSQLNNPAFCPAQGNHRCFDHTQLAQVKVESSSFEIAAPNAAYSLSFRDEGTTRGQSDWIFPSPSGHQSCASLLDPYSVLLGSIASGKHPGFFSTLPYRQIDYT
jgi:hypothetical protein